MKGNSGPAGSGPPREEGTEELARLLAAVAHPARLRVLRSLQDGVKCVRDLNELVPVSQPNLSQHIGALRRAGLVAYESRGSQRCYYVLRPDLVEQLLKLRPELHRARQRSRESVLAELDGRREAAKRKKKPGTEES